MNGEELEKAAERENYARNTGDLVPTVRDRGDVAAQADRG